MSFSVSFYVGASKIVPFDLILDFFFPEDQGT